MEAGAPPPARVKALVQRDVMYQTLHKNHQTFALCVDCFETKEIMASQYATSLWCNTIETGGSPVAGVKAAGKCISVLGAVRRLF